MIGTYGFKKQGEIQAGFTLIELMIVVLVIAIFAAIAIPSYQSFIRRAHASQALQEVQKIAEQLERHKGRNFNYRGFDASYLYKDKDDTLSSKFNALNQSLNLPLNSAVVKYTITVVDNMPTFPLLTSEASLGQGWSIRALSEDAENFSFLMNSNGVACQNKASANITYETCGEGGENW